MEPALEGILNDLKALRRDVKSEEVVRIAKKGLRGRAKELGTRWHRDVGERLSAAHVVPEEVRKRYAAGFTRLIRLSAPSNKRSSYLDTLDLLIRSFREDLLIPAQQGAFSAPPPTAFDTFFASLPNPAESEYLKEAVACAKAGHLRAAAVLGWSAGIDHIHRAIEAAGFGKFNAASARMAGQQAGRFKKFNQTQRVNSLSELRETFDTVVLWVVEGMELIDSNQHTRLRGCFEMRCQAAHPGDAPITLFNLMSFFSDLDQIVLSNAVFNVPNTA